MRETILPPRNPVRNRRRRVIAVCVLLALAAAIFAAVKLALPGQQGWSTVFSDNFPGSAGSRAGSAWTYDVGTQYHGAGCSPAWGTDEVEANTNATANASVDGAGHLNITPVRSGAAWTSARIETVADNFAAPAGGKLEVSASIKQPDPAVGNGYWPAFWMLGKGFRAGGAGTSGTTTCSGWPSIGEIDIMEAVNGLSQHSGTFHCGVVTGGPCQERTGIASGLRPCPGCQTGYNTYSVIIDRTDTSDESITWYLNGAAYYKVTERQVPASTWRQAVDHGFFLIFDVAIGGQYPDNSCKCTTPTASTSSGAAMSVGHVAVRQMK
jgi:beta-glucanase (GH16 family)